MANRKKRCNIIDNTAHMPMKNLPVSREKTVDIC